MQLYVILRPTGFSGAGTRSGQEAASEELFRFVFLICISKEISFTIFFSHPPFPDLWTRRPGQRGLSPAWAAPSQVVMGLSFMTYEICEAARKDCPQRISADTEAVYQLYSSYWIYIDTGMKDVSNKEFWKRVMKLLHWIIPKMNKYLNVTNHIAATHIRHLLSSADLVFTLFFFFYCLL